MGIIIKAIIVIAIILSGSGAYIYTHPEKLFPIIINGVQSILPKTFDLPNNIDDIINKNPDKESVNEMPFDYKNPEIENTDVQILGRPTKIVEFYCTNDEICHTYFKNINSKCEISSGNCYIN
ncbi:MAG: hypothetical protein AABY22_07480 [Nanoarchaeota archaeon]